MIAPWVTTLGWPGDHCAVTESGSPGQRQVNEPCSSPVEIPGDDDGAEGENESGR